MFTNEEKRILSSITPHQYPIYHTIATRTSVRAAIAFFHHKIDKGCAHAFCDLAKKHGVPRAVAILKNYQPGYAPREKTIKQLILEYGVHREDWFSAADVADYYHDIDDRSIREECRKLWEKSRLARKESNDRRVLYRCIRAYRAPKDQREKALEFISENSMCSSKEVALGLGISHQYSNEILGNLLSKGEIYVAGKCRQRRLFEVTPPELMHGRGESLG